MAMAEPKASDALTLDITPDFDAPAERVFRAFAERNGRTRLSLHQQIFESGKMRFSHHGGWNEAFDCLDAALAGGDVA